MRLIFMGTPDFAVPSLAALHRAGFEVQVVISRPDRPRGRGRRVAPPPVKKTAEALGLPVFQPEKIRSEAVRERLTGLKPDVIAVVAFGQILPKHILQIPPKGSVNLHASLLPKYRGPAPIQWALMNLEAETGVTTMLMDEGMDTGDMLLTERVAIDPQDTAPALHDRLAAAGADLLVRTLRGLQKGEIVPTPQDHAQASYAPMLKKRDGKIDWTLSAERIAGFVRAMTPWPGAFTRFNGRPLKIFKVEVLSVCGDQAPGVVLRSFPDELWVATGIGTLSVLELQVESGRRLPVDAFLRGFPVPEGSCFG